MTREIGALLARYCDLMDAADWDGIGGLFAQGALKDPQGNVIAKGAEAVASFYRNIVVLHDGSPRTKHLVSNVVLGDEAEDGSVTVRSSYLVLQADGDSLRPIVAGRYLDRFVRDVDGAWAFAERQFFVDLSGDTSRHLRIR